MKIEDIKPGDVIVRNNDEKLVKVAEVTSECHVMESAFYERDKAFCIFQKPRRLPLFSEDEYEPATEEQRQYMESKLVAFYGTNPEVESKRITALATMMGDLKQENNELAERVKQLMSDYNKVVKQLQSQPLLSKIDALEREVHELKKDNNNNTNNMIQYQQWYKESRVLITDLLHHGSVQVGIPDNDYEGNRIEGKADAIIYALWVDERYRKHGAARELLKKAEREAKRMGCRTICLEWDNREAEEWTLKWYERLGYNEKEFGRYSSLLVKEL